MHFTTAKQKRSITQQRQLLDPAVSRQEEKYMLQQNFALSARFIQQSLSHFFKAWSFFQRCALKCT